MAGASVDPVDEPRKSVSPEEDEIGNGGLEEDTATIRKLQDPQLPTAEEVQRHELTHTPYRSWCVHCVRGRGRRMEHRRQKEKERAIPEVHLDYCFMGSAESDGKALTILVARERDTRMTCATVVPKKGANDGFVAERVRAFVKELGYEFATIILKSDQEPAIVSLIEDIRRGRGEVRTMVEHSPVGESASNGVVERGIQSVQGVIRTFKSALEERWRTSVPDDHPALPWMVEHAAVVLNKCEIGADGKTAHERLKGKKATLLGLEFGEAVLFRKKPLPGKMAKLSSVWEEGVYLGHRAISGENIVGTKDGVWKTRTVQRKPAEKRWSHGGGASIGGLPWGTLGLDADIEPPDLEAPVAPAEPSDRGGAAREPVPRRMYFKKADFEVHGYTPGCVGCRSILQGKTRQGHSETCRARMEKLFDNTERFLVARKREQDFLEKAVKAAAEEQREAKVARGEPKGSADEMEVEGHENKRKREASDEGDQDKHRDDARRQVAIVEMCTNDEQGEIAWDDVADIGLDLGEVKRARAEEVDFLRKEGVYEKIPVEECWRATGHGPTSVKWIDTNKGTVERPVYRSRLVARDFKARGGERDDVFAAMPPLEAKKLLLAKAAVQWKAWKSGRAKELWKLMFVDVKKAHLYGECTDPCAYVELPPEDAEDGMCGKLRRWLYGMRGAASGWEQEYGKKFEADGYIKGVSAPTVMAYKERRLACVVWGDDFTFLGPEAELNWAESKMRERYEIKMRGILGPEPGDLETIEILNRTVAWKEDAIEYRADKKHAELLIAEFGLDENSNGVDCPGVRETDGDNDEDPLDEVEAKRFRGMAARANYLAADRPDIQYAAKEACRKMSAPSRKDWGKLKRIARYLVSYPELVIRFSGATGTADIVTYVDANWAGCVDTRRSTSGGVVVVGGGCIKSWSSTQGSVALSSGESELYGLVKGAAEAIGIRALMRDLGWDCSPATIKTDSSAAKSMAVRRGVGRVRHLETRYLWIQEIVAARSVRLEKVASAMNVANALTKYVSAREIQSVHVNAGIALEGRESQ